MKHIIVIKVDNKPGVVSRIAGLFTRRGYNIESLVTSVTQDPQIYQLTISLIGTNEELNLLIHQVGRIMEVIEIYVAGECECVTRELMFIKINCAAEMRSEVMKIAEVMDFRIAGVGKDCIIVEATGDDVRIDSALRAFHHLGISEIIRSGAITIRTTEV